MKTLNEFFKVYKSELPLSYQTFRNKFLRQNLEEMKKRGLIAIFGNERLIVKILDDEKFKEYLFELFKR
jgi:hypothetical protein